MKKGKKRKQNKDDENYVPKAFRKDKEQAEKNGKNSKNNKKEQKKKETKKKLKRVILIVCMIAIIVTGILLGISAQRWKKIAREMIANENSIVLDSNGKEIAKLGCERKNKKISLSNMPDNLKNAYVAIEDERFY